MRLKVLYSKAKVFGQFLTLIFFITNSSITSLLNSNINKNYIYDNNNDGKIILRKIILCY